jgi:pyruvate/2-oxoglutarate dehydrogenase complex dihydrolipoamide acyltransferase (E2) component
VGDLAAVMREAVLWTSRGRNVTEDDLTAMLEGREDLSEVQENPFAEMMKEDEAAEGAQAPAEGAQVPAENAPVESATPAEGAAPTEGTASVVESVPETPIEEIVAPVVETSVDENEEWIASSSTTPRDDVSEESVDASIEPIDESPAEEQQPSNGSNNEPNMTDEEFEAFMKKAQAFYDSQASENSDDSDSSDDDDDFPSIEVHTND